MHKPRAHAATALLGLVFVLTAACAPRPAPNVVDPSLGVHVTSSGQVVPSAAVGIGGVSVAASPWGGAVGTRFGPIRLSAGF